jgi:thiamine kinase-like enzyme
VHSDCISSLSCWRGEISVETLSGGITNHNYLVRDAGEKFVVRLCEDCGHLGIDRRNERLCQQSAQMIGVSPELVHAEGNMLVTRFIDGPTLKADETDASLIQRLASTLKQLHDSRELLTGEMLYFCPFQTVRTYAKTARQIQATLPGDIEKLLDEARQMSLAMPAFQPTLCHNDLLPANILDDGDRLWLIDWEYAGIGNPVFDLAGLSANCGFNTDQNAQLVQTYAGNSSPDILSQIQILKSVSLLREALWAVIQTVKSQVKFEYQNYADENFEAYRNAR